MTTPDEAMLWARNEAAKDASDEWLARMTVEGRRDDALAVSCRAIGYRAGQSADAERVADAVCLAVAELPDRTSPDDWPDAMLVTADELRQIVRAALGHAS